MRKYYLDNIRWITIVIVVFYHMIYIYNGIIPAGVVGPFYEKQWWDGFQYLCYPWFMVLLFIVAGITSRYYLDSHPIKEFIKARTLKLLVPCTIGILVFQWIQGLVNVALSKAFEQMPGSPLVVKIVIVLASGIGVLWFIQMLWLFSLLLALVRKFEKGCFCKVCSKTVVVILYMLGIPVYFAAQVLNTPAIVVYRFGIYGLVFFIGYFVFSNEEVIERLSKLYILIPNIVISIGLGIAYTVKEFGNNYAEKEYFGSILSIAFCWITCLAILGGFYRWGNKTGKFASFMSGRSFGIYVFHYLGISLSAYLLNRYTNIPALPCYIITLLSGFVFGLGLNEIISRIPFIRWCVLGIKKKKTEKQA